MKDNIRIWFDSLASKKDSIEKKPDEFDAKKLVNIYSIKTPYGKRFAPEETFNIGKLDSEKLSPPYVLKVCSSDILHKTEMQGVLLNIDKESVKNNFKTMQSRFPDKDILVENQTDFMGPEFIIGIIKDPALGHAIMVGAGGVLTEIYKDTSFRLAPCSVNEAMDMIDELVISPIFENFRGIVLDKKKLARTISQVSKLAHDIGDELSQLDINPIVFSKGEWIALDVKVVLEK
ncbi:MAG: acetate--CoA ligase family protein [Deltaproteobacteria bacterium]|nr:acetate--CoA ligase family protein [Deltaproteobacteria bacterium]